MIFYLFSESFVYTRLCVILLLPCMHYDNSTHTEQNSKDRGYRYRRERGELMRAYCCS